MRAGPAFANSGVVRLLPGEDAFGHALVAEMDVGNRFDEGGEILQRHGFVIVRKFNETTVVQGVEEAFHISRCRVSCGRRPSQNG